MTYYEILEVSESASKEVIHMAYKALAKKYHPDVFKGDYNFANSKMKQINEAYEVLSNPEKRKVYDDTIKKYRQMNDKQHTSSKEPPSETKTSSKRNAPQFPKWSRSAVIIATCLVLAFAQVIHPYIESEEFYDYAIVFGLRDFALVSFILMIVPVVVGTFKKSLSFKTIKQICAINSISVFFLSFVLYLTESTATMRIGWILALLYYFTNKHMVCQIQVHNSSSKVGFKVGVILTAVLLFVSIIGGTTYIASFEQKTEQSGDKKSEVNNSVLIPQNEPDTAYVFEEDFYQDCVAPLKIVTTGDVGYYFVVDLVSLPDNLGLDSFSKEYFEISSQIAFYVRGGDSVEFNVPLGMFEIYYASLQYFSTALLRYTKTFSRFFEK